MMAAGNLLTVFHLIRRSGIRGLLIAVVFLASYPASVYAQEVDAAKLQQALARAQGLLRQVAQQKADLEAQLTRAKVEKAGQDKKLKSTKRALEEKSAELDTATALEARLRRNVSSTSEQLEKTRDALAKLGDEHEALQKLQAETEAERARLEQELATTQVNLEDSETKNLDLYKANMELLGHYREKGALSALLQREPFTGLRKVEVQNLIQEYEYKMYDSLRETNLEPAQEIMRDSSP